MSASRELQPTRRQLCQVQLALVDAQTELGAARRELRVANDLIDRLQRELTDEKRAVARLLMDEVPF